MLMQCHEDTHMRTDSASQNHSVQQIYCRTVSGDDDMWSRMCCLPILSRRVKQRCA